MPRSSERKFPFFFFSYPISKISRLTAREAACQLMKTQRVELVIDGHTQSARAPNSNETPCCWHCWCFWSISHAHNALHYAFILNHHQYHIDSNQWSSSFGDTWSQGGAWEAFNVLDVFDFSFDLSSIHPIVFDLWELSFSQQCCEIQCKHAVSEN